VDRQERWRARYAELRPGWRPSTTIYRELIDERVDGRSRLLDVGCGRSDLLAAELAGVALAVGADPDHASLLGNGTVDLRVVATGERLPFRDAAFDLVVLTWVLEHLERPVAVFREIDRVLASGGRVAFLTPNAWNYNAWLIRAVPNALHRAFTSRLYGRSAADTFPTRYRCNSPRRIGRVLAALGFVPERVLYNGDPSYIAMNEPLFRLGVFLESLYRVGPLRRARVHIIGVYRKTRGGS
jgi:SAM-dependent methyltransferase